MGGVLFAPRATGILSRLDHPNIVSPFDSGEFDGAPWYAMSYVGGDTLQRTLKREKQLGIPECIRVARLSRKHWRMRMRRT